MNSENNNNNDDGIILTTPRKYDDWIIKTIKESNGVTQTELVDSLYKSTNKLLCPINSTSILNRLEKEKKINQIDYKYYIK